MHIVPNNEEEEWIWGRIAPNDDDRSEQTKVSELNTIASKKLNWKIAHQEYTLHGSGKIAINEESSWK